MTPQSNFMISAIVHEGQLENLRALLHTMNAPSELADAENTLLPFGRFQRLHVARFVIIEANTSADLELFGATPYPWRPALAFLGDCDGDRDSFLAELVEQAGEGLKKIFAFCEEFSADNNDLLAWLKAHNYEPAANYINWIGRTVKQVHEEAALHRSLSARLAAITDQRELENCRALRQTLLSHVEMEKFAGRFTLSPPEPTPSEWQISNLMDLIAVPLILLLLSPVFLIAAPFLALRLRMLENSDPEIFIRPDREHIKQLSFQEDRIFTNQFNVFGDVKPGLFRLYTLKLLLILLNYASRHVYHRGFLSRIRTIHFARWVLMDNNRRIYFASNYDGSEESYMDDFINKAGWGLNLVFSNAVGYPTTKWLIKQGAEREQQYKYTLRRHQLPSEVWYKAYPEISAYELARNTLIRQGVEVRQSSDAEILAWLSLI